MKPELDIYISLKLRSKANEKRTKVAIGFKVFECNKGQQIVDDRVPLSVLKNEGGYTVTNSTYFDGKIKPPRSGKQYVLWASTFDPNKEADFKLSLWYKKKQGTVTLTKL